MEVKTHEAIVKEFGTGTTKVMNTAQLGSIERVCNDFRNHLMDVCTSHAVYRCTLTSSGSVVSVLMTGADKNGGIQELEISLDLDTKEVFTRNIKLNKDNVIGDKIYELIIKLMSTVPFSVGMLDFPTEGEFKEGVVKDYALEPGTVLISIKDSLDSGYFIY